MNISFTLFHSGSFPVFESFSINLFALSLHLNIIPSHRISKNILLIFYYNKKNKILPIQKQPNQIILELNKETTKNKIEDKRNLVHSKSINKFEKIPIFIIAKNFNTLETKLESEKRSYANITIRSEGRII